MALNECSAYKLRNKRNGRARRELWQQKAGEQLSSLLLALDERQPMTEKFEEELGFFNLKTFTEFQSDLDTIFCCSLQGTESQTEEIRSFDTLSKTAFWFHFLDGSLSGP